MNDINDFFINRKLSYNSIISINEYQSKFRNSLSQNNFNFENSENNNNISKNLIDIEIDRLFENNLLTKQKFENYIFININKKENDIKFINDIINNFFEVLLEIKNNLIEKTFDKENIKNILNNFINKNIIDLLKEITEYNNEYTKFSLINFQQKFENPKNSLNNIEKINSKKIKKWNFNEINLIENLIEKNYPKNLSNDDIELLTNKLKRSKNSVVNKVNKLNKNKNYFKDLNNSNLNYENIILDIISLKSNENHFGIKGIFLNNLINFIQFQNYKINNNKLDNYLNKLNKKNILNIKEIIFITIKDINKTENNFDYISNLIYENINKNGCYLTELLNKYDIKKLKLNEKKLINFIKKDKKLNYSIIDKIIYLNE